MNTLDEKCPECGKPLVEREGRYGKFVGCSGYPECKYIKRESKASAPKAEDARGAAAAPAGPEVCPECGKPLVEKEGRFGKFLGCSGYPQCKYIKKPEPVLPDDAKCPECGKPLVIREGRFGKFVGCSGYPQCKYIQREKRAAGKVLDEKCPECGKPLVEREGRYGKFAACSGYPECKYIKRENKARARKAEGSPGANAAPGGPEVCPECGKPLVEKEGRFGKFLGCSGYPQCKYIKKSDPVLPADAKCPECGKPLVIKEGRFGKFVGCSGYPECKYRPPKK